MSENLARLFQKNSLMQFHTSSQQVLHPTQIAEATKMNIKNNMEVHKQQDSSPA